MISYTEAVIVSTTVQAVLTGAYFATFLLCLRWQIYPNPDYILKTGKSFQRFMLFITIIIFVFAMTDLAISLEASLLALRGADNLEFAGIIAFAVEAFTAIIVDGVLVYHCWIIYQKAWSIAAVPLLFLVYNLASVITLTSWASTSIPDVLTVRYMRVQESFEACTVFINIYATSAIIIQIWREGEHTRRIRSIFTIRAVAESGVLYTLTSIPALSAIFIRDFHNGSSYPLMMTTAISSPFAGIAYNLLVTRAAKSSVSPSTAQHASKLHFREPNATVESKTLDVEQGVH
ncbi:hypothetical protein F5887DRAFT_662752 [Amanita rubescens]|nr:hypothetical protein F5887DRAFT_662752 [Amanita rubescens]